jgi:hypothetical protein
MPGFANCRENQESVEWYCCTGSAEVWAWRRLNACVCVCIYNRFGLCYLSYMLWFFTTQTSINTYFCPILNCLLVHAIYDGTLHCLRCVIKIILSLLFHAFAGAHHACICNIRRATTLNKEDTHVIFFMHACVMRMHAYTYLYVHAHAHAHASFISTTTKPRVCMHMRILRGKVPLK